MFIRNFQYAMTNLAIVDDVTRIDGTYLIINFKIAHDYFSFCAYITIWSVPLFWFFALALLRSWRNPVSLALSRSLLGLKFRAFAFLLSRS